MLAIGLLLALPALLASADYTSEHVAHDDLVVGPRRLGPFYYGQGCTSQEFASAVFNTRVSETGSARVLPLVPSTEPADFKFSSDWPSSCPPPHVFTKDEACDLLSGFGGLFMRGDSIVRQVTHALFIILSGKATGATTDGRPDCVGDKMFSDKENCRFSARIDSQADEKKSIEALCGGTTFFHFEQLPCPVEPSNYMTSYSRWHDHLPLNKSALSTITVQSYGLHCRLNPMVPLFGVFKPLFKYANAAFPRPLMLWFGIQAPGSNKPVQFLDSQGAGPTQNYNAHLAEKLAKMFPGGAQKGAMGILDFFMMTQGALSFDGTHYMYQINMEKAHILLNYLDILWGEIVHTGGYWDLPTLCPGPLSYQCNFMKDPPP